jgi:uncharacterized membrane protein YgcG
MTTALPPPPSPELLQERYPSIVKRIGRGRLVRTSTAARWLHETMKFLDLCAESAEELAPSKKVDHAWHEFLLHTREYEQWCHDRYRKYIHHTPMESPDGEAYERTLTLLEEQYGSRDRKVWPRRKQYAGGACGGGCGGSCGGGGHGGSGCSGSGCSGSCGGGG